MTSEWAARADAAEAAILARHLRRVWSVPSTRLGVCGWPATRDERWFGPWNYWWQAHLIDCAVDAAYRAPTAARTERIKWLAHGQRLRNVSGWTSSFYDDMAWLGLALERAQRVTRLSFDRPVRTLSEQMYRAWAPERGGGIPWCRGSDFYNAPANGPAGILLARTGNVARAVEMADWIDATLRDPATNVILDGIRPDRADALERAVYTYCQGVVLGLETELALRIPNGEHPMRVARLVGAVGSRLTRDRVIVGGGGGDGGLFNGILARYLAFVAVMLPDDPSTRAAAARIVLVSAESAWRNREQVDGLPLFSADWSTPARMPTADSGAAQFSGGTVQSSVVPERDLSVQLSGWMLMEAAAYLSAAGY
ncbi:fructose-bisphosphate aldolase [Skermania sp. ID1734]|uniref:glycoside hydrolase family 76 protein n=1 Tax=Skermania sp. ID1734 TaxID=2597516 RepID=UPI00117CD0E0|nr:glycoside hydrolase family 76 protein [Skermania sp. ID1734]TSD94442.1 fructose-bisphosphate aldolase [Skermania sp. ID1734]